MKLVDPTVHAPKSANAHAPRLAKLDGARMGLLSNGKANADALLRETARVFAERHGCQSVEFIDKRDASRPSAPEHLRRLSEHVEFLITAVGD